MEEIGKSERAETPERRLSLQRRSYFREYAPTHPPPPSRWNSLAAAQPTDTANLRPHVPSETRASKGGGRERTSGGAGAIRPPAGLRRPQPVTCGESAPSPGLSALHADPISPAAAAPRPAHEDGARRQVPLGDCGAPALELVTTSRGDRASEQPAAKGALAGRGGAGGQARRGLGGVARSYLTPSVFSVLSSTAAAPAVAAAATFLGSAPAAVTSSSTLCSPLFRRRAHREPRPFGYLPRPPQHTRPETLSPTAPAAG